MSLPNIPRAVQRAVWRLRARLPGKSRHRCCVCGHEVRRFLPYRDGIAGLPAVAIEADIVGSDVENFECPVCGSHDRERHLFMYLRAIGLIDELAGTRVLHFAPEAHLQQLIAAALPQEYVRADLHPRRANVLKLDLTAIDFPDECFDLVIANHVLEHVSDDSQALREIHRVLRPGGRALLQTPFAAARPETIEDRRISEAARRLCVYGQEDHCGLYGANFESHVVSFGFVSQVASHEALLPQVNARECGVNSREPLMLFAKPGACS